MTGIWEFPELEELRDFIETGISQAQQTVVENFREEGDERRADIVSRLSLERIIVVDEWGMGTAEIGEDPLDVFLFFDLEEEEDPSLVPEFDPASRTVVQQFITMINLEVIFPPERALEWFAFIDPQPVSITSLADQVSLSLGRREGNTVFDLTRMEAIRFVEPREPERPGEVPEPVPFEQLPRIPLDQLREEEAPPPEEEEEVPPEPEPEEPEEPEPIPAEEQIRRAITEFEIDGGELEIPAGKPTKRVELQDLFDFEVRMGLPANVLGRLEDFQVADALRNGIGWSMTIGRFGLLDPPATFPRTSSYVRNRLLFEGPVWALELYRDLVFYSGFISAFYDMNLRPGSYLSLREFMYRLKQINERGGPELIVPLSQQAAAARGLETLPDHPTIEGEKAPWLERRQYYEIVEENADHDAWEDPTEFLYEVLPAQEA